MTKVTSAPAEESAFIFSGKRLAGERLPLHGKHNDEPAQAGQDALRLLRERAPLGKFFDADVRKPRKPLAVLGAGVGKKFFFEPADTDDTHLLHHSTPATKI